MASFYTNVANEEEMLKLPSYPSSELDHKSYARQPSVSVSDLNLLSGVRDDAMFISPTGVPTSMQHINMQLNFTSPYSEDDKAMAEIQSSSSGQTSQYQGLCLSLGSREQSFLQFPSNCTVLSSHIVQSEDQISQDFGLKNVEYLSFDLSGRTHDAVKHDVYDFQNLFCSKETTSFPSLHQTPQFSGSSCNSRYLRAAQDLLDEVVSVRSLLKQSEKPESKSLGQYGSTLTGGKWCEASSEIQALTSNATHDLSPSELQDMHHKMTKLLSMLDEVDTRYKRYFHQMQAVVSSFDAMAGHGASKRYSALALQRISCQFRALRDAIKKQVQVIQQMLGDQDVSSLGHGVLPRLRYVDQKIRQQRAIQQFGMLRQPWRPQRGLPETAVSVLRAWLFEHFLHPYPKEAEKIVLAKQAGLTRSQVANWFINARVRLWKPMIEDIYKEEFSNTETELKQSPQHDAEEEFPGSLVSPPANSSHWVHPIEPRSFLSDATVGALQSNEAIYGPTTRVSLALGLQCSEKELQPTSEAIIAQVSHNAPYSTGLDNLEYYDEDTAGVSSPNLSSDYVE